MTAPTIVAPDVDQDTTTLEALSFEPDCEACRQDPGVEVRADFDVATSLDCCGYVCEAFLCTPCKDTVVEESREPIEGMHCSHCKANEPSYTVDRIEPL